jgi:PAS domain S-box-containing protein
MPTASSIQSPSASSGASLPTAEARIAALRRTGLLDSPTEASFDRLTRLASRLIGAPVALVSLVGEDRQFFKSCVGLPEPWASRRETPLSHSFCQHVIGTAEPLIIEDAREHPLVLDNLAIRDLSVVAYAGIPLVTSDGHTLGSFCVIDSEPRQWTAEEVEILSELAASVMTEIELRTAVILAQEAEAALRESEKRFRLLVDASPELMWYSRPDGEPIYHNRHYQQYTGLSQEVLARGHWRNVIHPDDRATVRRMRKQAFSEGGSYTLEARLRRHDGVYYWHRIRVVPARDEQGAIIAWVGVGANLDETIRARAEAEAASRAKSEFLATMSHEIRTPINAIVGYTDLMEAGIGGPLSEKHTRYLERIKGSSRHLLTLISDVLDLAKVEAGEMQVGRERVPLKPVVEEALGITVPLLEQKGLSLSDETDCYPGLELWGDADRVRQILVNLLSNASKFTEEGWVRLRCRVRAAGPETVEAAFDGPWLAVEVADTGPGIAPQMQDRIFAPFVQEDSSHTRRQAGTGLGLAISRVLARMMAGDLTVQSTPGEGSTFTLWLPAATDEVEAPDRRSTIERRSGAERRTQEDRRQG